MKYYFSIKLFLKNITPSLTAFETLMEHWLADSASILDLYFFPNTSISYNSVVSYIWLIHYGKYDLLRSSQDCLIHIDLQDVPYFDSLILSNSFLFRFLLVFWLPSLAFIFHGLFVSRVDLFLYFLIKCSNFWFLPT